MPNPKVKLKNCTKDNVNMETVSCSEDYKNKIHNKNREKKKKEGNQDC